MIEDVRIILAGFWIALMLTYLLGDVIRIFAGHFVPGEIQGVKITQWMAMLIAVIMFTPILMLMLSLTLEFPLIKWVNIIAAIGLFVFNVIGIRGYPGWYDRLLIFLSLIINAVTVWYAWNWG